MTSYHLSRIALILAAGLAAGACAGKHVSPIANNAPEWVNKGSGAMKDKDGRRCSTA